MNRVRVLVVDDSAFMRVTLAKHLAAHPSIEVIATARDGMEAVALVQDLNPDAVTLDVEMPRLDGLGALAQIMSTHPVPVIMVSSLTSAGSAATMRALELGAIDFVAKPSGAISLDMHTVMDGLIAKILAAATVKGRLRQIAPVRPPVESVAPALTPARGVTNRLPRAVIAIGSSTGGPAALCTVMQQFPADLDAAVVIVQHMPPLFTRSLADRLNQLSPLAVKEAADGDRLAAGAALVAPGDKHLLIDRNGRVSLANGPKMHGVRPSVDVTWESLARGFGPNVTAMIMTGMGSDGAEGAELIRRAGGRVVAQSEESCVVYGMPKAVVERGAADQVVPLPELAAAAMDIMFTRPR